MLRNRLKYFVLPVTAVVAVACASASNNSAPKANGKQAAITDTAHGLQVISAPAQEGVQHLKFKYGPIKIEPGQNNITISGLQVPKPAVDGYIVGIHPDLFRNDGSVPPVDVIHLHHGVWLKVDLASSVGAAGGTDVRRRVAGTPHHDDGADGHRRGPDARRRRLGEPAARASAQIFFASGEEKTQMMLPAGLRLPVQGERHLGHQLHAAQPALRRPTRCRSSTTSTSSRRLAAGRQASSPRARSGST